MISAYSFEIDKPRHQRRCREALELLAAAGPALPFERPRRITDPRTGATRVWVASLGSYVGID